MKNCKAIVCSLLSLFVASNASAALSNVIPIPWEGDVTKFHTAVSGTAVTLKGLIKTTASTSIQYQWNFGDGSAYSTLATQTVDTRLPVSTTHTYTGSVGTPFVAWLIGTDGTTTLSNQYLVQIQAPGVDANINIAIDNGLWYLYKQGNYVPAGSTATSFNTMDQTACVWWQASGAADGNFFACATASSVQAFEINGSLASGNFNQDPYAEYTAGGLNFLLKGYAYDTAEPELQAVNISPRAIDPWDNPDSNANGIGIEVFEQNVDGVAYYGVYQSGQVMDALVASGTPDALSGRIFLASPSTHVATYQDVIQDMCDMYAWGEENWNYSFSWVGSSSTLSALPAGTPDSITFNTYDLSCVASDGAYTYYVNGQDVGTIPIGEYCSCAGGGSSVVVSGSALSTAWSLASPPNIAVSYSGGSDYGPSWVHASLSFSGDLLTVCLTNFNSGGCDNTTSACNGYSTAAFTASNLVSSFPVLSTNLIRQQSITGAWHYYWQYTGDSGGGDNSASQWGAIGQIAAQQAPFNAIVPQWVKTYDNNWLNYSYSTDNGGLWGHFGYNYAADFIQPDYYGDAETPSGLVQMDFDGITTSDPRWVAVQAWLAQNWDTAAGGSTGHNSENWLGNVMSETIYPAYSCAKAMRLAQPSPVVTFATNGFNWYLGSSTDTNGLAETVSDRLIADGYWGGGAYWEGSTLATAWAVIILKPNLFSAGPQACFSANPNPGFAGKPISFDPSCSTDPQPGGIANLVLFDWAWGDGTPDTITDTPAVVQHSFACVTLPCAYTVTLTVYDNSTPQLDSSAQQIINITQPPHPPVANPGGPYIVSLCACDSLTLIGSASYTPDQGLSQADCNTCSPDQLTAYGWALTGAPYLYTASTQTNVELGSSFTTFFPTAGTYEIGLQVIDNAALAFPAGTTVNLTNDAFTSVTVYNCGPTVTATAGCGSIALSWTAVGASSYIVLTSTTGPNSGFTTATTTGATNATITATLNQTEWIRVEAVSDIAAISTMSCAVEVTDTLGACVCITDLSIQSKATIVELEWPLVQGVTSYNVYRSTAPGVLLIPANRIATGAGTQIGVYTDGGLINGRTYYYVITSVADGVETCESIEVHATPAAVLP
jgi:hypothetical protein